MKTQELKQFVLQRFELGTEFQSPAAWAAYLRSAFPSANDDEIITALCEIVDGYEPNRSRGNPKVVKSHFGENGMMDFSSPNHRALTQMDSFLQNSEKYEKRWERTVRFLFQDDGGIGWEGVQKNNPDAFRKAWNEAVEFCEAAIANDGLSWGEIANA
jgi:hypothetical protein